MSILFDGEEIAQEGRIKVSGSSSPTAFSFPRTIGALLKPQDDAQRYISIETFFAGFDNISKARIELLHHELHELFGARKKGTLIVNNNIYTNVIVTDNTFDVLTFNTHMTYTPQFELDFKQGFLNTPVNGQQLRAATFNYKRNNIDTGIVDNFIFPILNTFESGNSVDFIHKRSTRVPFENGTDRELAGGIERIHIQAAVNDDSIPNMEAYMVNYLLGPLGKQGTLALAGNVFEDAILSNVTSEVAIGSLLKYNLEFMVSLRC